MASMPNHISTEIMGFDGAKVIRMEPGWVYTDNSFGSWGQFQLGLTHNSTKHDIVFMKAVVLHEIVNIESDQGLQFNVDGQKILLSSSDVTTHFDTGSTDTSSGIVTSYTQSAKTFVANKELIQSLLEAESVKVRLITYEGFIDGDFKTTKPQSAQTGFVKFMAQFDSTSLSPSN